MFRKLGYILLISLVILVLYIGCTGQNGSTIQHPENGKDHPESIVKQGYIEFDTLQHSFGTLIEGERVVCYFDYINNGEGPLIIRSVESSCGCTVPDYSRKPLEPGEKGTVKVVFDTSGRYGEQVKIITILSDARNAEVRLRLTANIIERK